ncbi:predicted protein [Candida tropicalis MYA-3404]|uniref:Transcription factor IIIC 90kDa subunit N-terminal domain-containing protein n=1 Tax=Candida tropicalis (strain ATCC MYA-3404 / T1) TaxID=294747 RepID=C5M5T7_CANTT|nr:predicted protein [Candida tropicalis MYA-3404]EER34357.1 predicted protein [Candida tropicalis MYA-3404]KAG4408226.1 hypothetical protein JTP64_001532 [Candida tropicalis]
MSLAKSMKINRVELAASQNTPVAWSDNYQISLNSYTNLKVLEPRLPNYFQTIKGREGKIMFETKEMFSDSDLLNTESIGLLPLGRFNKVLIEDNEEMLNLVAYDPNIVLQQWTPNFENSKDSLLGLLFNSGELLVLGRKNTQNAMAVRINMFDILANKYEVKGDTENMYVRSEVYKKLKIKYFTFSIHDGSLLMTIVDHSNSLLIFTIDPITFDTELKLEKQVAIDIIKIIWSNNSKYLTIVGFDNSLTVFEIADNLENSKELSKATRFKNHRNEYVEYDGKTYLVSTFTGKIFIYELESLAFKESNTDNYSTPTSIVSGVLNGILTLIVPFDSGDIISLKHNLITGETARVALDKTLNAFITKSMYAFQSNSNEESENVEPWFRIFALHALPNDIIGMAYKITQRDTINYKTPGFMDVRLQFLKLSEPIGSGNKVKNTSSVAKVVELCLSNYQNLPVFSNDLSLLRKERSNRFIEQMKTYAEEQLVAIQLGTDIEPLGDFKSTLQSKFIQNPRVIEAQYRFVLAKLLQSPLYQIVRDNPDEIEPIIKKIDDYKQSIENSIVVYLRKLILRFYDGKTVEDEVDKFCLITMYNQLRKLNSELNVQIPEKAEVTINAKYYSETFKVGTDDTIREKSTISSTSGHGWMQCQLTNIPLLAMNNKTDELALFRYIIPDEKMGKITKELLEMIDFCYITGNRIYPLK